MNNEHNPTEWGLGLRVLIAIAMVIIVIAGLKAAAGIVNLFLISLFIAIISASPVFWLESRGVPMVLGVIMVVSGVMIMATSIAVVLGNSLADFRTALPLYQERVIELFKPVLGWVQGYGVEVSPPDLFPNLDPGNILGLVVRVLGNVGDILGNALLILLTVVFMLLDAAGFRRKLHNISDDPIASFDRIAKFTDNVRRYLAIKTWISLATGLCIGVWVYLLGLDFPAVWGVLAFILNYVPNVGSFLAAVPAVLLAVVQLGLFKALLVAAGFLVVNFVIGNVVEPRVMGRGIGLSVLVVFLSLVFWGWVLGPVGMLLSVPLTMTLKIALESSEDTRWIATLLASENASLTLKSKRVNISA